MNEAQVKKQKLQSRNRRHRRAAQAIKNGLKLVHCDGCYYGYLRGCYRREETQQVRAMILKILKESASIADVNQVEEMLKLESCVPSGSMNGSRQEVGSPTILNLENGLLDLETMQLREHTPDRLSVNQLPVVYDLNAKCPRFIQFLKEIFCDEFEKAQVVQEYVGYVFEPNNRFEKAMVFLGSGANGKGTVAKVFQGILGSGNFTVIPLERIGSRFETAFLQHSMANFSSETSKGAVLDGSVFKQLVSGDEIRAEWKHGSVFSFRPRVKLFVLANHFPRLEDLNFGSTRRLLIVEFTREFKPEERDLMLSHKILASEKSGVFNWMLEGRRALLERGFFKETLAMQKSLKRVIAKSNSVAVFVETSCSLEPSRKVAKGDLFTEYMKFCEKRPQFKDSMLNKNKFGTELQNRFPSVRESRTHDGRYWDGIGVDRDTC